MFDCYMFHIKGCRFPLNTKYIYLLSASENSKVMNFDHYNYLVGRCTTGPIFLYNVRRTNICQIIKPSKLKLVNIIENNIVCG